MASVGFEEYAILDTRVMKRLLKYGVIDEKPGSLTRARYIDIEIKMKEFSSTTGIPFHHLDTLLWEEWPEGNDYPQARDVERIKEIVIQLSPSDLKSFRDWFDEFDADIWDQQFEVDVAEGRLDALANEALQDVHRGYSTDL